MTRVLTTSHGTNRQAFSGSDWGLFAGLSAIWGSSFLFTAIGLDAFHPGLVTLLRVGFGAMVMFGVSRTRHSAFPREDWPALATLALVWIAVPMTIFPIAQQWIDSGVAGMLNGATPIFTAIISAVILRQLPGKLQLAGLVIGFAGVIAIALPSSGTRPTAALGVVLILVATISYAFSSNIVAPLQQRHGSLAIMARLQWLGVILVLPYGLYGAANSSFAWPSLFATLAVGVLGTGLGFVLMSNLIGRVGPTRATFISYVIPVVALILGVVFRNEVIAPVAIAGVALVIAGAALASRREI
ncbi:MAG: DMT family transporter [Acidimicrobiia bacterium]